MLPLLLVQVVAIVPPNTVSAVWVVPDAALTVQAAVFACEATDWHLLLAVQDLELTFTVAGLVVTGVTGLSLWQEPFAA